MQQSDNCYYVLMLCIKDIYKEVVGFSKSWIDVKKGLCVDTIPCM